MNIIINEGKCFGKPGIRPSSMSVDVLDPLLTKHLKQSSQHSTSAMDADDPRRDNLKALAEKLMNNPSK